MARMRRRRREQHRLARQSEPAAESGGSGIKAQVKDLAKAAVHKVGEALQTATQAIKDAVH